MFFCVLSTLSHSYLNLDHTVPHYSQYNPNQMSFNILLLTDKFLVISDIRKINYLFIQLLFPWCCFVLLSYRDSYYHNGRNPIIIHLHMDLQLINFWNLNKKPPFKTKIQVQSTPSVFLTISILNLSIVLPNTSSVKFHYSATQFLFKQHHWVFIVCCVIFCAWSF